MSARGGRRRQLPHLRRRRLRAARGARSGARAARRARGKVSAERARDVYRVAVVGTRARRGRDGGAACAVTTARRPDLVRGDPQRARRGDRRDGAGAEAQRLLDEHQDPLGLLVRLLRRRAALGRAGVRAAGAPRLDGGAGAAGRPALRRGEARPGRRDRHERPPPERRAPERRQPDLAGLRRTGSCSATSRTSPTTSTSAAARPPRSAPSARCSRRASSSRRSGSSPAARSSTTSSGSILAQIRSKHETAGDFRAQIAANATGVRRVQALVAPARPGDDPRRSMGELLEYTERRDARGARAAAARRLRGRGLGRQRRLHRRARAPACADRDRPRRRLTSTRAGSDPQRRAPVNSTYAMTFSACAYALKCLDRPGSARQRRLLPARPPRRARGNGDELHVARAGRRRLGDADAPRRGDVPRAPARVPRPAPGRHEGDDVPGGLRLARRRRRELHVLLRHVRGRLRRPARERRSGRRAGARPEHRERARSRRPSSTTRCRSTRLALVEDSEGPGRFRGGLGLRKDYRFDLHDDVHGPRRPRPASGRGARSAAAAAASPSTCTSGTASRRGSARRARSTSSRATSISVRSCGGGGYGPPGERDPERVLRDVLEGKVSAERAREEYLVAIDGRASTWHATTELRRRAA